LAAGSTLILLAVTGTTANWRLVKPKKGRAPQSIVPLALCAASGILMAAFYPMLDWARTGEVGVGPYSAAVMVAAGIWFSAFVCNLFFMDLPVEGEPLELLEYFRGGFAVDRAGLAGGALWCAGAVASFAVDRAGPGAARETGRFCLVAVSPPRRRVVGSPVLAGIPASRTTAGQYLAHAPAVRRRPGAAGPGAASVGLDELKADDFSPAQPLGALCSLRALRF
jgi:hypothetical protein